MAFLQTALKFVTGGGSKDSLAGKIIDIGDKLIVDKDKREEFKAQIRLLILAQTNNITRFVRAILSGFMVYCWTLKPELFEGGNRMEVATYIVIAVFVFYVGDFLADKFKGGK